MKIRHLGLLLILSIMFFKVGMGCAPYHRDVVVIHDNRWHYDHDYDDNYRAHHPWHDDRNDWDH